MPKIVKFLQEDRCDTACDAPCKNIIVNVFISSVCSTMKFFISVMVYYIRNKDIKILRNYFYENYY